MAEQVHLECQKCHKVIDRDVSIRNKGLCDSCWGIELQQEAQDAMKPTKVGKIVVKDGKSKKGSRTYNIQGNPSGRRYWTDTEDKFVLNTNLNQESEKEFEKIFGFKRTFSALTSRKARLKRKNMKAINEGWNEMGKHLDKKKEDKSIQQKIRDKREIILNQVVFTAPELAEKIGFDSTALYPALDEMVNEGVLEKRKKPNPGKGGRGYIYEFRPVKGKKKTEYTQPDEDVGKILTADDDEYKKVLEVRVLDYQRKLGQLKTKNEELANQVVNKTNELNLVKSELENIDIEGQDLYQEKLDLEATNETMQKISLRLLYPNATQQFVDRGNDKDLVGVYDNLEKTMSDLEKILSTTDFLVRTGKVAKDQNSTELDSYAIFVSIPGVVRCG